MLPALRCRSQRLCGALPVVAPSISSCDGNFRASWKLGYAFGVDPVRRQRYSLRQARYDAAAEDIDRWAANSQHAGRSLKVIDVGCKSGTLLRHLEHRPHFAAIEFSGSDVADCRIYKHELYREVWRSDLEAGNPEIPSNFYDVVVCEQVLEHLKQIDLAIEALERILKPGGRLIVGVPIFVAPLAFLRRSYVAATLAMDRHRYWSHIQSFSLPTFLRAMRQHSKLTLLNARGFRVISEGLVTPLENYRWWWKLNRKIGEWVPWACIEVQAVFEKPAQLRCSNDQTHVACCG